MPNSEKEPAGRASLGEDPVGLLPPGWELVDWTKKSGVLTVYAERADGFQASVQIVTLPMACEEHPITWLRQVLDLELLRAIS